MAEESYREEWLEIWRIPPEEADAAWTAKQALDAGISQRASAMVAGDLPDFISPVTGTLVRGRKGLREHCERHNVTPVEDLKGLPPKPAFHNPEPTRQEREATRRTIADVINSL